ncbi:MAG: carbohydrate kinase family protein [Protaetiibacter sp.]
MTRILVAGAVSWNRMVVLDALPEPRPHMEFAREWFDALGGTSAGKALHLHALGRDVVLDALVGADDAGDRIRDALARAGVPTRLHDAARSEQHLNLMTPAGARLSLYLATPDEPGPAATAPELLDDVDLAVLDLAARTAELLAPARERGIPIWTDLHDYDGESAFHRPFLEAADAVFMNADRSDDPWRLLARCLEAGPRLAVCTLGAEGAIALDASGRRASTRAEPTDVVDTNGAGDAFFAGFLDAWLGDPDIPSALRAGARQAVTALATRQLHPVL